jgi:hypothetical protein
MTLPSESLGVVAHAADDLRVEPGPLRKPAADEAGGGLWRQLRLRPAFTGCTARLASPSCGRRWCSVTRSLAPWPKR